MVSPRVPAPPVHAALRSEVLSAIAGSVEEVNALVEQLEGGARGIPPLLRHYLRLDAKVLAFNVDPGFGNCLDALITVHLPSVSPRILQRCMGDAMDGYLSRHRTTHGLVDAKRGTTLAA